MNAPQNRGTRRTPTEVIQPVLLVLLILSLLIVLRYQVRGEGDAPETPSAQILVTQK